MGRLRLVIPAKPGQCIRQAGKCAGLPVVQANRFSEASSCLFRVVLAQMERAQILMRLCEFRLQLYGLFEHRFCFAGSSEFQKNRAQQTQYVDILRALLEN